MFEVLVCLRVVVGNSRHVFAVIFIITEVEEE